MNWSEAFAILGVQTDVDTDQVRRAYARVLRRTNPEDDPQGFKRLREAHDLVMRLARPPGAEPIAITVDQPPAGPSRAAPATADDEPTPPADLHIAAPPPSGNGIDLKRRILADLVEAQQRFEASLSDPEADPVALGRRFHGILHHDSLDPSIADQIEGWSIPLLAHGVADRAVREALVPLAIERFGWRFDDGAWAGNEDVDAILRTDAARRYADEVHATEMAGAWGALTDPQTRWTRMKMGWNPTVYRIDALIDTVDQQLPDLRERFDPSELAYWRAYAANPQLRGLAVVIGGYGAAIALGFTLLLAVTPKQHLPSFWIGCALVVAGFAALPWLDLFAVRAPNRWWNAAGGPSRPTWQQLGWVPLGGAMVLLAIVLPPTLAGQLPQMIGCGVAIYWALVTAEPVRSRVLGQRRYDRNDLWVFGALAMLMFVLLPGRNIPSLGAGLLVLLTVRNAGRERVFGFMAPFYERGVLRVWGMEALSYLAWLGCVVSLLTLRSGSPDAFHVALEVACIGYLALRGTGREFPNERRGGAPATLGMMTGIMWLLLTTLDPYKPPSPPPPPPVSDALYDAVANVAEPGPSNVLPPASEAPVVVPPPVLVPAPPSAVTNGIADGRSSDGRR